MDQEQEALAVYRSASSPFVQGATDVTGPGANTPASGTNVTDPTDSPMVSSRALPQSVQMPLSLYGPQGRAPPLDPFYGFYDGNQRTITTPQWESWLNLFELHHNRLPEPDKLEQLRLYLRGEALAFRTLMLDTSVQGTYKSLVEALTQHYAKVKAPHVALNEFYQLQQGTTDVKSFAQKFQRAYMQASRLNPHAAQTPRQLCTTFVSKVDPELVRILTLRYPDYASNMQLHQVVVHLAVIEPYAYSSIQPSLGYHRGRGGRGANFGQRHYQGRYMNRQP
ncbi:MAG: hypothetical protein KDA51_10145, partial [Planctomycetales bacterium]|nr:hypothetical protein [Planctomycetales bacterium]